MSQLIKTVFYSVLRNNHATRTHLCSYVPQLTPTDTSRQPQDTVMQTLRSSTNSTELLNSVSRHLQAMNQKHMLQVLRSLFELNKNNKSDRSIQEVLRNPTFGSVCQGLKSKARTLEPNEYIEVLKILCYLKVPFDTVIQQTMLQLVRHNINDLSIRQIIFLDFIISKTDSPNPLVDALKLALPLVFQIRLPLELDHDDLPLLNSMLSYACKHNLPDRCINNIVAGLLMHGENFDYHTAKNNVWSLTCVDVAGDVYSTRVKLLEMSYPILSESIDKLAYMDMLKLAAKLKNQVLNKHSEFYNEGLYDAIAEYIITKNENLEMSTLIARNLSKINHTHIPLMEYLCRVAYNDLGCVANAQPNIIFSFVNCLSNANYVPEPSLWDAIKQQISMNRVMRITNPKLPYTKFGLELASLGHYDVEFLSNLFSEEHLQEYLAREENLIDYRQIVLLHEAAKTFCEGYNLSPPEHVLDEAKKKSYWYTKNPQLEESLTMALGGSDYHAKHVQLSNGLIADYIIAIENGKPIPIHQATEEDKSLLHQLNIPQSAVIICIIKFSKGCYSINADRLRGVFRLMVELLERQGYPTVPVNMRAWARMPESERVPYLVRDIETRCQEHGHNLILKAVE